MSADLDLSQVRAFAAVAATRNFTRAAERLFLSQQALSKRVARLEDTLGGPLFERRNQGVELTASGERFRPAAEALLKANDEAVAAARGASAPLRVDVIELRLAPMFLLRRCSLADPSLRLERSTRHGLANALDALARGEIDLAFGRAHDLGRPVPSGLSQLLVRLEPLVALLPPEHPLASGPELRVEELREEGIWLPSLTGPPEFRGFLESYFGRFGVPIDSSGASLDLRHTLEQTRFGPPRVTLAGGDMELSPDLDLRKLPFAPSPLFPWSVLWRTGKETPAIRRLIELLVSISRKDAWCEHDPAHSWLSEEIVLP